MTIIAFFMNVMLPFIGLYSLGTAQAATLEQGQTEGAVDSPWDGRVLICTPEGFKWVSLEDAASQSEDSQVSQYSCAFCTFAQIDDDLSALMAPTVHVSHRLSEQHLSFMPIAFALPNAQGVGIYQSRAPPVLSYF